ncbi:MAG TPA: DUF1800 domain-containing protein [Acidimicrobiales bacterium]
MAPPDRQVIAFLHRRAGWGLAPGELDARTNDGVSATIDRLVDPDAHGVDPAPDPWQGVDLTLPDPGTLGPNASVDQRQAARQQLRQQGLLAIEAWLDQLATTPRPLVDWMTWFWHGHFVSGLDKVKLPYLLVQQLRTFRSLALAPFPQLVKAATVDPAMLVYLDGDTSTGAQPNENYGRELLELFSLGIGNYSEDDVQAGARALTGWAVQRQAGTARFVAKRHDDAPQTYLGTNGVHDVDSVVAAVTGHPACATFITTKLAKAILGPTVAPDLVGQLTQQFTASGLDTKVLVRAILEAGAAGGGVGSVNQPVPWLVSAQRATGATFPARKRLSSLRDAGQLPLYPPNVAGWPTGTTWFGASTTVARYDMAAAMVGSVAGDNPAFVAARNFDVDALADTLGRPEGFAPATRTALAQVKGDGRAVLALALSSPDLALA